MNRADDIITDQNILKGIIRNIAVADLIIADVTAQNANVYYELGIAHTLSKPTIQIVQDIGDVPFDLRPYHVHTYSVHFTSAEKLTKSILDIIERDTGEEFNFANPVVESISSDSKKDITISTTNISNNNEVVSAASEEEVTDESTPGFLDSIVLAEDSIVAIGEITEELIAPMNTLSVKTQSHAARFNELNSNPNQKGLNSKRLQVARQFASDLNEFASCVSDALPRLNSSWIELDQAIGHVLSSGKIEDENAHGEILTVIQTTKDLIQGLKENVTVFESFRQAQKQIRGLSKATDRALTNSDRTLEKLLDEFKLGDSVLARIIELASDMINRYQTNNPDNGNTP